MTFLRVRQWLALLSQNTYRMEGVIAERLISNHCLLKSKLSCVLYFLCKLLRNLVERKQNVTNLVLFSLTLFYSTSKVHMMAMDTLEPFCYLYIYYFVTFDIFIKKYTQMLQIQKVDALFSQTYPNKRE